MTYIDQSVFQLDQFDRIPSKPGLYCWMARPNFDRYSWELQEDESEEDRTSLLLGELAAFCKSSGLQPVRSDVTAFFDSSWSGKLEYTSNRKVEASASDALTAACNNNKERRLLVDLISSSFPLFWQPLYIGVAKDLKTRLLTHKRVLNGSELENVPASGARNDDLESARGLGERLCACHYRAEELWVYTLEMNHSELGIDTPRAREIAEVAESWLNILNTPKLGRA